jgi:hypothetical protein
MTRLLILAGELVLTGAVFSALCWLLIALAALAGGA